MSTRRERDGAARHAGVALALAVLVQLVVVYAPSAPPTPDAGPVAVDKLVHLGIFALPAALAPWALRHPARLWAVLVAHAPLSEWLQHAVLPGRSGDLADLVADLLGVALGIVVGALAGRRERTTP